MFSSPNLVRMLGPEIDGEVAFGKAGRLGIGSAGKVAATRGITTGGFGIPQVIEP
jgi:hypothetical protein